MRIFKSILFKPSDYEIQTYVCINVKNSGVIYKHNKSAFVISPTGKSNARIKFSSFRYKGINDLAFSPSYISAVLYTFSLPFYECQFQQREHFTKYLELRAAR